MIGSLNGKVILKDGNSMLIDVNGVGYKVLMSGKTIANINLEDKLFVYIYSHIREDVFDLFGFKEIEDLKLFENLISVSGVGPKTALSIFSFADRNEVVNAVLKGDVDLFTKVPRLGKKNAQKIIIELKSRFKDTSIFDLSSADSFENEEVVEALKTFGFSAREALDALKNMDKSITSQNEKIKYALKYLGK